MSLPKSDVQHHLAVLYRTYLDAILAGEKTIECRLGKIGKIPYGVLRSGDVLWLKESGGPIRGMTRVGEVRFFENLTCERVDGIRRQFNHAIGGSEGYWESRREARYATLAWLDAVCPLPPFRVVKRDLRAWVVLAFPPIPGEPLISRPAGLA